MAQKRKNVKKNERSWAIELISQINEIANSNDLVIKRAGGEATISSEKKKMFPDVLLYGSKDLTTILQGWELKMPDVPITDEEFVNDAQRKAQALELKTCIIWNFTYVKFYVFNEEHNRFEEVRHWDNPQIKEREDVETYRTTWENTLKDVVFTINAYFLTHKIKQVSIGDIIPQNAIDILINENKEVVAVNYKMASITDTTIEAKIDAWWQKIKTEYTFDETDKYKAYAKTIILNWSYRIIFAHLIKRQRNQAFLVDNINVKTTPKQADDIFKQITKQCDFFNIFASIELNTLLPQETWDSLIELSLFLKDNGIQNIDQTMLQNILEKSVNTTRRELHGQYTTPQILAHILVSITIRNLTKDCGDPCCGTGTIASELLKIKKSKLKSVQKALDSVWASDKYDLPLQIANISMTSSESMNCPNRIFKSNALDLYVGKIIKITNPKDGKKIELSIPKFGAICSNLPFVAFENIPDDDKELIKKHLGSSALSSKSDLYQYLALYLSEILCDDGWLGIITSNAWLGTTSGALFYKELIKKYDLKQVHISGAGRWFKNADIVTTILILQKKKESKKPQTKFYIWHKSLEEIKNDPTFEKCIVNTSLLDEVQDSSIISNSAYLLDEVQDSSIISNSAYSSKEIEDLHNLNLSYNALFHDVKWLLNVKSELTPLQSIFKIIRGSRRGWDELFFPQGKHNIEKDFIKLALFNAKKVTKLITTPDREAFCCSKELAELEKASPHAFSWIKKFETQRNGTGKLLKEVLKRSNEKWYEMKPKEIVQFFTMMNPNDRLFFGRFSEPAFINQRFIGLSLIKETTDIELCHALLNSILMKFFIEAVGFGRGLGVLDINKDNLAKCYMLNPSLVSAKDAQTIKNRFKTISNKDIMNIEDEINDIDWIEFNKTILRAYGIETYYEKICASLLSLRKVRQAVKQ